MKKILLGFTVASIFILASCSSSKDDGMLVEIGLDGLSAKEILSGIASNSIIPSNYSISVADNVLQISYDNEIILIEMPEDEFYISVAPYINVTHECLFHSATQCQGELLNERFHVSLIDIEGNDIIDGYYESLDNGFIDLWLPRNIEGVLTITYGDLTSTKVISTFSGEPTCETTLKLT